MDAAVVQEMRWLRVVPPGATTQLVLALSGWRGGEGSPNEDSGRSLVAPDIDAANDTLRARGVRFRQPATDVPSGQRATWFSDPDGTEFFLGTE